MAQSDASQENTFVCWGGNVSAHLSLLSLKGHEATSETFRYEILSEAHISKSKLADLFRQQVYCTIGSPFSKLPQRCVNGIITAMNCQWIEPNNALCSLTIEPAMALMKYSKSTRSWKNISTPEVVQQLLREYSITHLEIKLNRSYAKHEFCIQYRESDFDFISRLLDEAGIYYFFTHDKQYHTLVLADHPTAHSASPGSILRWHSHGKENTAESLWQWSSNSVAMPGEAALSGYDINQAASINECQRPKTSPFILSGVCYSDITPAGVKDNLSATAKVRVESWEENVTFYHALTNAHWLACGETFQLHDHCTDNGDYRIQAIDINVSNDVKYRRDEYLCSITALPQDALWHPVITRQPAIISDVLTARVVGPKSETVHTNELGQVQIVFPWDNTSDDKETSGCWVRVNQPWTGNQLGAQFLPRVGSEVQVMFNQGQPMVIGFVYNGINKPPFPLPANKAESGFLSRQIGNNEKNPMGHRLSFNDTAGAEKMTILAPRDLSLTVKNSQTTQVGSGRNVLITQGNDALTLDQGNITTSLKNGSYDLTSTGTISFTVNNSSITLSSEGISIKGPLITISASGDLTLNGKLIKIG